MSARDRVAIVDVGSNSARLLLAEEVGPDGPRGERATTIVGLARDAGPDRAIRPPAIERLDRCLADYGRRLSAFAPAAALAVGTSAVRDAPNRADVAAVVERRLGCGLLVLDGAREAALAFAGARLARPAPGPVLVVDIGGGSTELAYGEGRPERDASLQLGAVRCTDALLRGDPPSAGSLAALRVALAGPLAAAVAEVGVGPAVGVAGTITTLAAIEQGRYDPQRTHCAWLARARAERLRDRLAAMALRDRERVPGLEPGRAPVIVAGAAILAEVLAAASLDGITVSERDLLDGAAMALVRGELAAS